MKGKYVCKRRLCAVSEITARRHGCDHGPCPMEIRNPIRRYIFKKIGVMIP